MAVFLYIPRFTTISTHYNRTYTAATQTTDISRQKNRRKTKNLAAVVLFDFKYRKAALSKHYSMLS